MKLLLAITALCAIGAVHAQPTTAWINEPGGVAMGIDAADNVYSARWDYNPAGDIYVAKRNAAGVLQWEVRYDNTDTTRHEVATWVDADSAGNVLVSGTIRSGYSSPVNANSLLMKFAPDGRLLWRKVYEGAFDGSSTRKLLVDASDNVYVLGLGTGPAGQVSTVRKFNAAGDTIWSWFDPLGIGAPVNVKWTPDGALLLSARAIFGAFNGYAKIDRDGKAIWISPAIASLTVGDAAGDASGNSYLINSNYAAGTGSLLRKLAPNGTTVWERSHPMSGFRVEVGPDGAPLVSGFPNSGTPGAAFMKFNAAGSLLWTNLDADGPAIGLLAHSQMKLDAAGNAYLAAGNMSQMGVTKVRSDGASDWTVLVGSGYAYVLAIGKVQQVFVTGGIYSARIDQAGGPPPSTDLALTLTDAPDPVSVGAELVFKATATNRGPAGATGVKVGLTLPGNVSFVRAAATQGSCTGTATVGCALGSLASGGTATVTVTVRPNSRGVLSTSASVSATEFDPDRANNTAGVTTRVRR